MVWKEGVVVVGHKHESEEGSIMMQISFHLEDGEDFLDFQEGKKVQLPTSGGLDLTADMITVHCLPTEVKVTTEQEEGDSLYTFVQKRRRGKSSRKR